MELAGQGAPITRRRGAVLPPVDPRHAHGAGACRPAPGHNRCRQGCLHAWAAGAPGAGEDARITVPQSAVGALAAPASTHQRIAVLGAGGQLQLRQVRLGGPKAGVEVSSSGVAAGETVLTGPQTAPAAC